MKFVALISGGKDSCYNAIKCVSYGHELVCMGNLCPPDEFVGEEVSACIKLLICIIYASLFHVYIVQHNNKTHSDNELVNTLVAK